MNQLIRRVAAIGIVGAIASCQLISGLNDVNVDGGNGEGGEGEGGMAPFVGTCSTSESDPCNDYCGYMSKECGSGDNRQFEDDAMCCAYCEALAALMNDALMCRTELINPRFLKPSCFEVGPIGCEGCDDLCALAQDYCSGDIPPLLCDFGCPGSFGYPCGTSSSPPQKTVFRLLDNIAADTDAPCLADLGCP